MAKMSKAAKVLSEEEMTSGGDLRWMGYASQTQLVMEIGEKVSGERPAEE